MCDSPIYNGPDNDRHHLTVHEAIEMLPDLDMIHTFRGAPGCLLGADWTRDDLLKAIRDCKCEIGGETCQAMNHGLVVWVDSDPLFVECKEGIEYNV